MLPSNAEEPFCFPTPNDNDPIVRVGNMREFCKEVEDTVLYTDKRALYYDYNCGGFDPIIKSYLKDHPEASLNERVDFFRDSIELLLGRKLV